MRTARSITSGENFGDVIMMAPFSIDSKAGAVHELGQSASRPHFWVHLRMLHVGFTAETYSIGAATLGSWPA